MQIKKYFSSLLLGAALLFQALPAQAVTNYLTSCGVQQAPITIANGSLTGTNTLSCAVGSGAFIIFQGENPTDTAIQLDDTTAYLTLTNSTTVTATRGVTGSSKSIAINSVVIDGDTTNLIKSVQFGTVTINSGGSSGTATITSVTNTNTAIAYLGQDTAASLTSEGTYRVAISLSGTTVTASFSSGQTAGQTLKVGFVVVEFQGAALNQSVQNVAVNTTQTGTSKATTVTSVNLNNTMLFYGGFSGSTSSPAAIQQYGAQTAATTYTTTWNTSTSVNRLNNVCIVEFVAGVLAQNAQRGTIALAGATSNTAAITNSATSSTVANWLGNSTTAVNLANALTPFMLTQTNATTLTETCTGAGTGTGSYEAIQFTPYSSGVFQTVDEIWFGSPI